VEFDQDLKPNDFAQQPRVVPLLFPMFLFRHQTLSKGANHFCQAYSRVGMRETCCPINKSFFKQSRIGGQFQEERLVRWESASMTPIQPLGGANDGANDLMISEMVVVFQFKHTTKSFIELSVIG
jgi:hypothetical protein